MTAFVALPEWIGAVAGYWREHSDTVCQIVLLTAVYVCVRVSLGWLLRIACERPYPKWGARRIVFRVGCVLGSVFFFACLLWSFIEPYHPVVTSLNLSAPGITKPLRLVQITDLHCDDVERAEPELVRLVAQLKPEAILFTGDGFNTEAGAQTFFRCMRRLGEIAPVYGVRGNWEVWSFPQVEVFGPSGMKNLEGEAVALEAGAGRVWIAGAQVGMVGPGIDRLKSLPAGEYKILLQHYPCNWREADRYADLQLSGDTHGGQIHVPLLGPFAITRRIDGRSYPDGLQKPGERILLYVNHGFGMMGGMMPRVRFNCPPEITLITLNPASAPAAAAR